ncbi:MAG: sodium:proton antiporter [Thermoguttaceae bacterium]|nr:sodium:proton antiporter [Thermoguttaceae bacterium]
MSERKPDASPNDAPTSYRKTIAALVAVIVVYLGLLVAGLPQKWTAAQFEEHGSHDEAVAAAHAVETPETVATPETAEASETNETAEAEKTNEASEPAETAAKAEESDATEPPTPPLWTVAPFVILLLCIAILPLIPATAHWWESNRNRFIVAAVLGAVTLGYYAFCCDFPLDAHWPAHSTVAADASPFAKAGTIFVNAIVGEYISFVVLLFSLFAISGGIRISGNLKASPGTNAAILTVGALLASFVGTTGAAMLLIRLLLETNKERKFRAHTVVFFIFAVCNCGGCLLPIGDPPLFLGYLRGVAFFWTFALWKEWLFVCGLLIAVYYLLDRFYYWPKETGLSKALDATEQEPLRVRGLFPNLFCLIGVVLAVALLAPSQEFLSLFGVKTGWYPPTFLREVVQLALVAVSFACGSNAIRKANEFNFAAIVEVAAIFFGIFICMQPPMQILNVKGGEVRAAASAVGEKVGMNEAQQLFWMTGSLSSVLDNAPTYVVFFEVARVADEAKLAELKAAGQTDEAEKLEAALTAGEAASGVRIRELLLVAVSLGAVLMGAMTYIGNGPNFMVKAIAEESGVKMPSFFGYIGWSVCALLPILVAMTLIFL